MTVREQIEQAIINMAGRSKAKLIMHTYTIKLDIEAAEYAERINDDEMVEYNIRTAISHALEMV